MATRIRLQRHGKKDSAFYHVVVADGRAPRDGAFIQKLGTYNPNTNPATINIDFEQTLAWIQKGATPTDTCRAILSYKGVMMKKHLLDGVKKGAHTEEQAEAKFQKWIGDKEGKVVSKKDRLAKESSDAKASKLKAESAVKDAKAAKIAAKNTPEAPAAAEETTTENTAENTEAPSTDETTA
jgi:small subunit ribosomal protein S16